VRPQLAANGRYLVNDRYRLDASVRARYELTRLQSAKAMSQHFWAMPAFARLSASKLRALDKRRHGHPAYLFASVSVSTTRVSDVFRLAEEPSMTARAGTGVSGFGQKKPERTSTELRDDQ
jgi:hypothetical protein